MCQSRDMATSSSSTSSPPAPTLPCLVFDYGDDQNPATLFSVSGAARRACEIEELRGKRRSWPTAHGWVLAWDPDTTATFLWKWDPRAAAADRIPLPALPQPPPPWRSVCALSGSPTAAGGAGCTVLLAAPPESGGVLWYCHAGGAAAPAWGRHEYDPGGGDGAEKGPYMSCSIGLVSCRGRFYYCHSPTECGVIDFSPAGPPALGTVPMESVPLLCVEGCAGAAADMSTVVEIDGELYVVSVFFHGTDFDTVADVGVYRKDLGRREHVRVESIGDRAILAGSGGRSLGRWCPATEFGLLPNSVYWMSAFDRRLHVFDIELGTEQVRDIAMAVLDISSASINIYTN
ncbi:unnamed protein product [Urochloa decumbens]|uniref:KIB1-4 beta-propeller domain-containing protein n=1 Tax=Urochloa decumbens TaxID=240449 RepID=A0ABC9DV11_9POAL